MSDFALVALIVFGAGIVRGFSGFGFALAAAPLLALVLPPHVIVPLVLLLDLGAGAVAALAAWREVRLKLVLWLALPSLMIAPFGALLLSQLSHGAARLGIGLVVLAAVPVLLMRPRLNLQSRAGRMLTAAAGGLSGLLNGAFGLGGPPIALVMASSSLPAAAMRATTIAYFLVADSAALASNAALGNAGHRVLLLAAFGIGFVLAGNAAGSALFHHFGARLYRRVIALMLTLNALVLILSVILDRV